MLLFFLISCFTAILFFFAGVFIGRTRIINKSGNPYDFQKLEILIIDLFSSLNSLLNFEKNLTALFRIVNQSGFSLTMQLYRFNGIQLTNVLNKSIVLDESVKEELLKQSFTYNRRDERGVKGSDEFFEFGPDSPVQTLLKGPNQFISPRHARLYPIPFDYLGVRYFFVLFYQQSKMNREAFQFVTFVQRQLFLVLYLHEVSTRSKENYELLDGVFHKNPISMCLTDDKGGIVRTNKGFITLFPKGVTNIEQLIDNSSFALVMSGSVLEKDYFYEKKNLKIRGTPLYTTSGNIRGCLFTILDDSLQYLLFKRLETSEERYKTLLKELPVGLVIINHDGVIFFVNDNFVNSLGFTDGDSIKGNLLQDFFEIPSSDFKEITGQIGEIDYLYYKFNLKPRFGNRIFSVHLQKIFLGEDELIEAVFQDVTLENRLYAQLEEKTKLIEEELSTARRIWEHILSIPPLYSSMIRFETFFKPSSQLGGDFYDIIQIDDIHIGVIIADVSGHGVSASLITSMLKMLIEFAPKDPHRLDDMVSYLNLVLMRVLPEDQYITLFYGIIDTKSNSIEYINCGHPFPVIYNEKTKEMNVLKGVTFPLGTKRNMSFSESILKAEIPVNGKMLLYTDGILTFRKPDRLMKMEDLVDIFEQSVFIQTKDILNSIYMKILKSSSQFTDDDVSMLLLIFNKEFGYKKSLSIPSNVLEIDNAIIKIVDSFTRLILLDEDEKWKLYTALYEAIINAVEHGNKFSVQKRVTVIYRIYKNWIVFKIRDEGIGFNVQKIPDPLDDSNLLKPSGRGVYMIRKIMDKVKYNSSGNEVTMYLKVRKERLPNQ